MPDPGRLLALACCVALAGSFLFMHVQRTLAGQFGIVKNTVNSVTTTQLYSPTGLSGSRSGTTNTLTWTAASPMNGNGYAVSGINNGASSTCPTLASSYTTYVGSSSSTTYADGGSLANGTAGTYVCYLVRTGFSAAGGPPWASLPTWTSYNTLPTTAVLLTGAVPMPTLVQSNSAADATGLAKTVSATWPSATAAGHLLVAVVGWDTPSDVLTMPAGWVAGPSSAGTSAVKIFYYPNAPSFLAGSSVKATFKTAASMAISISEWNNVTATAPFDASGSATATAATSSSVATSAATGQSGELAVSGVFNGGAASAETFTPGAGWTELNNTGGVSGATMDVIYQVQATAGAATATDSWTVAGDYAAAIATFKHS